jgi:hypothetical protein
VRWQRLTGTFVETERVVQEEFWEATRRKPGEATRISQAPESEAAIPIETVPSEVGSLGGGTRHGLDGIPYKFTDMPELNHHYPYHNTTRNDIAEIP